MPENPPNLERVSLKTGTAIGVALLFAVALIAGFFTGQVPAKDFLEQAVRAIGTLFAGG